MKTKFAKHTERGFVYAVLIGASVVALFPIYWVIASSFKSALQIWDIPPSWIWVPTLESYKYMLIQQRFWRHLLNSAIVSGSTTTICVVFGSMAAYALTRYRIKGSRYIALGMIAVRMMPALVIILPLYMFFNWLRLLDTYFAVILAHTSFSLPFAIWLLIGFFRSIPTELDEAAAIDGCSTMGTLIKIIFPIAKPGIITIIIFCMIWSWNDLLFTMSLSSSEVVTAAVRITRTLGDWRWNWIEFYAGGTMAILPIVLLAIFAQKYLVRGLSFGALK